MAIPEEKPGLVIFIRRIPAQVIEPVLKARLQPYLTPIGISANDFELHKPRAKGIATMFVFDRTRAPSTAPE